MDRISKEWDSIASTRSRQIRNGLDTSFNNILLPNIISILKKYDLTNVLDVGCGTGELTKEVSKVAKHIDAIDISNESLKLAKDFCLSDVNISFINSSIELFESNSKYSLIYSNMVLMDLENFKTAINSIYSLLEHQGVFVFSIVHPCFWSIYKNYYQSESFDYFTQKEIELPFDIGKEKGIMKTIHFHRSLEFYVNSLVENKFTIIGIKELTGEDFKFPRFIMFTCKKR